MKTFSLLFLFIPFFAIAQTKSFKVEGKLEGYPDSTLIRLVKNGDDATLASAILSKGKFTLSGSIQEPTLCFLIIGDQQKPVEIYMENSKISVKGNSAKPGEFEITGSASQNDFAVFVKRFLPMAQQLSALAGAINNTMPGEEREGLMKTYISMQGTIQKMIDEQVTKKPASPVTLFLLDVTYNFNEDPVTLENRYDKLSATVRNSIAGQKMKAVIAERKVGAVGTFALDFTQPDTNGKPVSLSSFRGKYVLVDFWASWCGPCRQENPNVVENYNKFNSKNFTVLGVSLDRQGQKDKWIDAIQHDNLTWTHVSDLQFWNNAAAKMYHIESIPQNMLLDPSGKIIARNLRGPALEEKLCELLGCN